MISLNNFQFDVNRQFKKTLTHWIAFHLMFSKIMLICLMVLSITVKIESIFSENVTMKFMTIVLNEMIEIVMDINSSYVACCLIWLNWHDKQWFMYCRIFFWHPWHINAVEQFLINSMIFRMIILIISKFENNFFAFNRNTKF